LLNLCYPGLFAVSPSKLLCSLVQSLAATIPKIVELTVWHKKPVTKTLFLPFNMVEQKISWVNFKRRHEVQMFTNRSKFEIIGDILNLRKAGKTNIMYACNLGHSQMENYLQFLVTRGFLRTNGNGDFREHYEITANGEQLLNQIKKLMVLMESPDYDADMTEVAALLS